MKKDYLVTVKVRNNNIINAIKKSGGTLGSKWCNANDLGYIQVNDLINLKISPLNSKGELSKTALRLCEVLNVIPEDLWSNEQIYPLETNFSNLEMSISEIKSLNNYGLNNYLQNFDYEKKELVDRLLSSLTDKERSVIKMRIFEEMTLEETGKVLGVEKQSARMIEAKALRKLRNKKSLGYVEGDGKCSEFKQILMTLGE